MNVLLVTLDTTRADALGCYGAPGNPTPNLDGLAAEGTRFDLAIATAAVTPVSHASILTGLENAAHGLRVLSGAGGHRLDERVPTLATVLRARGYATGAVHSAFPVSSYYGFQNGFDVFESVEGGLEDDGPHKTWDMMKYQRRSDETTGIALDFLERTRRPFFLWVHYWDPHDAARLPPRERLPKVLTRPGQDGAQVPSRELYEAEVSYVDSQLGRILELLRRRGELDRTIVVAVADHGEGLGDHGWDHHRILYQEEIRVPMIVRAPDVRSAAGVPDLVRTVDLFPTVLDLLGIAAPEPVSGASLRGLMSGRSGKPRVAFADQVNGYDRVSRIAAEHPLLDFLYCAMDKDWKLVYRPSRPERSELYELARDPGERANLFAERTEEARRLERELARQAPWVTAPYAKDDSPPGDRSLGALGALGYAGDAGLPAAASIAWAWTCPDHPGERTASRAPCRVCGGPPILLRKDG